MVSAIAGFPEGQAEALRVRLPQLLWKVRRCDYPFDECGVEALLVCGLCCCFMVDRLRPGGCLSSQRKYGATAQGWIAVGVRRESPLVFRMQPHHGFFVYSCDSLSTPNYTRRGQRRLRPSSPTPPNRPLLAVHATATAAASPPVASELPGLVTRGRGHRCCCRPCWGSRAASRRGSPRGSGRSSSLAPRVRETERAGAR